MQSNNKAVVYLQAVRDWLLLHPNEIIVFWMSKHGDACNTTYPYVTPLAKQLFFDQIIQLFNVLLLDTTLSPLNVTTMNTLLHRNHRVVLYISDNDYDSFAKQLVYYLSISPSTHTSHLIAAF